MIGTIYGSEEPDRYVLIGNHRDSWVNGAIDAGTGTSVTAEIGRVLGELLKTGWRPRRTIKVRQLETYSHRAIFNWISKVIWNYLSFPLHHSMIGREIKLAPFSKPIRRKAESNRDFSITHAFLRFPALLVICSFYLKLALASGELNLLSDQEISQG